VVLQGTMAKLDVWIGSRYEAIMRMSLFIVVDGCLNTPLVVAISDN
jgi:hypothetical protein